MAERRLTSILGNQELSREEKSQDLSDKLGLEPKLAQEISKISDKPRVNILADQPAVKDALGFDALVRTLADVVLSESTQTPITICVDGGWGTGKTSILRMLESQARMLDFPCIWLNAWSLESTDNMLMAVAREIAEEFEFTDQPSAKRGLTDSLVDWLTNAAIALSGSSTASILSKALDQIRGSGGLVRASREREQEINDLASIATTHRSFERLVDTLFEHSRHEHSRLVVFIDDLDRALPDQITTILRNLKLILETPRCVFVLAMDMDVVARAIANHYRQQDASLSLINLSEIAGDSTVQISQSGPEDMAGEDFGYHYLEKLIQISAEVPSLTRESVNKYLRGIGIAPEVLEIVRWAPDEEVLNPRRLKRYINWLSVSLQLILSVPMPSQIRNVTALRAMALRHDYPEVYALLVEINSKGQGDLKTPESYTQVYAQIRRARLHRDLPDSEKHVFVFSEDELRRASNALDIKYDRLKNETNELLTVITYLMMVSRSSEAMDTILELPRPETICTKGRQFEHNVLEYLMEHDERFLDLARRLVESQPIKKETSEFLQYLSKLPGRELLAFDRFLRKTPVLDVGRREYWISREEKRDRHMAQRLKQIAQANTDLERPQKE